MWPRLWSSTHKKQLGVCTEYIYISEFMLWLHRGEFVNIKWVKISSLAVLQVAKYKNWSNVHEPLKNRIYLEKKYFLTFWMPIFSHPKAVTHVKTACIRARAKKSIANQPFTMVTSKTSSQIPSAKIIKCKFVNDHSFNCKFSLEKALVVK